MSLTSTDPRNEAALRNQEALLLLAALDKSDFAEALRRILRVDAEALEVARVSLWMLRRETLCSAIVCEQGWVRREQRYERGATLLQHDAPTYFEALQREEVISASDAVADARTRELARDYLLPLGISSMLDVPVWVRGELVAVLCHEHDGPKRTWTHEEQAFAVGLAQTIATALEARERNRAERRAQRATFLAESSAVLTETLDITAIPSRLVALAVPLLGDWCVLDVLEGSTLRRLASAHADPAKVADVEALYRRYPPHVDCPQATARAVRTGATVRVGDPDGLSARDISSDPEHVALLQWLGFRSGVAVPLSAHGRTLGALAIVSANRSYSPDDVALAEELGRRAAIALDHARLFRESQDAIRVREEFLSVASHELYTPLTALDLAVARVRRGAAAGDTEACARAAELMLRQSHRLSRLIGGLLDVSRVQSGIFELDLARVDLVAIARAVARACSHDLAAAGCPLDLHADGAVELDGDAARLEQVVTNLLTNAIKFGAGKPIAISVDQARGSALLTVRDHGIGIPADQRAKIFDRFEQAAPSRHFGGLGLGLYIARAIVQAHRGTIAVESHPEDGTTFRVTLPLPADGRSIQEASR